METLKSIYLDIKVLPGENVGDAMAEAIVLAGRLGVNLAFQINGARLTARPGGSIYDLMRVYAERMLQIEKAMGGSEK